MKSTGASNVNMLSISSIRSISNLSQDKVPNAQQFFKQGSHLNQKSKENMNFQSKHRFSSDAPVFGKPNIIINA